MVSLSRFGAVVLGQETTTKSHKIRRVEMSQQLQDTLKEIRQLEAMAQGRETPPWVFLSPEGQRWDDRNLRRGWYRCLDKAEVREVRFHDLRHTYVSLLIEQGAHPKYIQGGGRAQQHPSYNGHLWSSLSDEGQRMG